jgi:hypothetical protein
MVEKATMTGKFDAFKAALRRLCIDHGVQLAPDMYDRLQVWDLPNGEEPLRFPDVEDKTEDTGTTSGD